MEIIEETERLIIREMTPEDFSKAGPLFTLFNEVQPSEAFSDDSGKNECTEEMFEAYIKVAYGFFGYGYYGVVEKVTNDLIGIAGFREGSCPLEIGYCIRESKRNMGFASEAVGALLKYAREYFTWVFDEPKQGELTEAECLMVYRMYEKILVYGRIARDNIASQKVLLNNGFMESESFIR